MSCSRCSGDHDNNNCPSEISFELDGTVLYGRCGAVPIRPIDLAPLLEEGESDTTLSLDITNKRLVHVGEDEDTYVSILDLANLINIQDLGNVDYQISSNGDLISYDEENNRWTSYTVPSGTIVTPVGVGADGNLVKDGSGGSPTDPSAVPVGGTIAWFGNALSIPVSYRELNGQAISRSVYADLFAILGTTFGSGDGSTTFNLPNLKGRQITGYNPDDTQFNVIGQTGGAKTQALGSANNGPHTHSINPPSTTTSSDSHRHSMGSAGTSGGYGLVDSNDASSSGTKYTSSDSHSHTVNIGSFNSSSSGSGTPFSILDPYIVGLQIMRVI